MGRLRWRRHQGRHLPQEALIDRDFTIFTDSDIRYDGNLKLRSAALYGDCRPFAGAFRIIGGVSFLTPKVTMTFSPGLVAAVPQADRDAEVQDFKDEVAKVSFFPVSKFGIGHAF